MPEDIQCVIDFQVNNNFETVAQHRLDWCRTWLKRAAELDVIEKEDAEKRHRATAKKRLKLTKEILESLGYEDIEVLQILEKVQLLQGK